MMMGMSGQYSSMDLDNEVCCCYIACTHISECISAMCAVLDAYMPWPALSAVQLLFNSCSG
jgi:hypothetical protein